MHLSPQKFIISIERERERERERAQRKEPD